MVEDLLKKDRSLGPGLLPAAAVVFVFDASALSQLSANLTSRSLEESRKIHSKRVEKM